MPKMAESPKAAIDFLEDLAACGPSPSAPGGARLIRRAELKLGRLESWDIAFASEKLRAKRYAFSDQEVKEYFSETQGPAMACSSSWRISTASVIPDTRLRPGSPDGAVFRDRRRARRADRAASISTRTRARPSAAVPGWTRRSRGDGCDGGLQTPGGLPVCNFSGADGRQAGAAHSRRRDHAVPRVRPRAASPAHASR